MASQAAKKSSKPLRKGRWVCHRVPCGSSFTATVAPSKCCICPCHLPKTLTVPHGAPGACSHTLTSLTSPPPPRLLTLSYFPSCLQPQCSSLLLPHCLCLGAAVFGSFPTKVHTVPSFATYRQRPVSPVTFCVWPSPTIPLECSPSQPTHTLSR